MADTKTPSTCLAIKTTHGGKGNRNSKIPVRMATSIEAEASPITTTGGSIGRLPK